MVAESADLSTRQRLLDAAERLFGERGYEGTSLRAVTQLAGTNIAAVNYHFRGKEALLQAVVGRAMAPVNAERERRLTALEDRDEPPTVEQIVRAFVEPGVDLADVHGDRGPAVVTFIATVVLDPSPRIRQLFADQVDPVEGRFLDALRAALPEHDDATVVFGYTSMMGLLALRQAGSFRELTLRGTPPGSSTNPTADRERLIDFLVGGLTGLLPFADPGRG